MIMIIFVVSCLDIEDYWNLYSWSVENIRDFWKEIWDFCGIQGSENVNVKNKGKNENYN